MTQNPSPEKTLTRRSVAFGIAGAGLVAAGVPNRPAQAAADYPPTQGEMQGFVLLDTPRPPPNKPFLDGAGNVRHFTDFKGKVLLVNFWATWCAPCIEEMPSLSRLQAALSDEPFHVLAVSQDRGGKTVAEPFIKDRLGISNLTVYYDSKQRLGQSLGVRGIPSSFVINAAGDMVGGLKGSAEWDSPDAIALFRHVLGQKPHETTVSDT